MKSMVSKTVTAHDSPKTNFIACVVIGVRKPMKLVNTLFLPSCPYDVKTAMSQNVKTLYPQRKTWGDG